ncbi:MAG: hypothetical protein KGL04_06650 [Elusimicrobia bacterium]|nr:hypothetical protein [Elusimicrobiota bacterium]MDE2313835.1 hypothetical protein [Elusimicrobiota bacterium]
MKTLVLLAVVGVGAWFVYTHIKQVDQVQKAAAAYVQGLKGDAQGAQAAAQGAQTAVQNADAQTQALEKSIQKAKAQ